MRFAILGDSAPDYAMAADLALRGFEVELCGLPQSRPLQAIKKRGGIELSGVLGSGFAPISRVKTNVEETIKGVDIITVGSPVEPFLEPCVASIENEQTVVFTSGYYWALECYNKLTETRKGIDVAISEMSISPYVGITLIGSAELRVIGLKREFLLATIPSERTEYVVRALHEVYPQMLAASNVLETSLNNVNHIFHAPILLLNAGRVESTRGDFLLYIDGATPSVVRIMEALDRERLSLTETLGLKSISSKDWLLRMYKTKGDSLYESIHNCKQYSTSRPRKELPGRLSIDIPRGLLPMSSLASLLGISTPIADMLIELSSIICQVDYRKRGLTVDKIGLAATDRGEILNFVTKGMRNP